MPPFTDFNIYKNQIITEWKEEIKRIKISRNKNIKTQFVDDLVMLLDSEDALQFCIHKMETVTSIYELKISKCKTKTMAFKCRDPVRSKIVINNNIREQIKIFISLSCSVLYQKEIDITVKL